MAELFTISGDIQSLAQDAIDTMINQLGKLCLLAFDSGVTQCPNCHYDPTTKTSSGVYNGTGPRPFARPPCPICGGRGTVGGGEYTEEVRFLIDWQPKVWQYIDMTGVKVPQGIVQAKGFITDLPKVMEAKYIIIDYKNAQYADNKFYLWGEAVPTGNIVKNRYIISFWTRLPS